MKKLSLILIVFVLLFSFTGCYSDGSIIGSLPEYENKEFYTDRTVQNFTNFGKYSYKELKDSDFEGHKYFKKIEDKEIEEISAYTFNFLEVIIWGYFLSGLTGAGDDVFVGCDFRECHWSASMKFLSRNTNFCTKTKLSAIGE